MKENIKLLLSALTKYILGLVMIGSLLFLPARYIFLLECLAIYWAIIHTNAYFRNSIMV